MNAHPPLTHSKLAFGKVQDAPQAPQLLESWTKSTQEPLQQLWPAGQTPVALQVQVPPTHVSPAAQAVLQAPQLLASDCRLTVTHVPLLPHWPAPQAFPQALQL